MKLFLLMAAIVLTSQGFAASVNDDNLQSASLRLSSNSDVLEFKIDDQIVFSKEISLEATERANLAQKSFTDPSIQGYACNVSHTPSETTKWSIVLYNFNDPQDEGEVVFSTNKNKKIQSVACLPSGERLIFSSQETTQGDTEIYSLDLLTNEIVRLTDNDTDDNDVSISQDGMVIAWQKRLDDGRQAITIRSYDSDGQEFTEKSLASANPFVQPSLSANGEWLALVQLRTNNFLALRYDVTNNSFKTIHSIVRRKRLFHPSVSNDGNMYSWVENKAQSKFVVKNISDNTITKLVTGVAGIEHPYLVKSGESVMYSVGEQTLIKNIRTGATEEVAFGNRFLGSFWMGEPEEPTLIGSWGAGEVVIHFLPDGRYLAMQWDGSGGYEYGTYVASDGNITFTTKVNNDGDAIICWEPRGVRCGLDGVPSPVWPYSLTDKTLTLSLPGEGVRTIDRIESTDSPVDGLWELLDYKLMIYFMGGDKAFFIDYFGQNFEVTSYNLNTSQDGGGLIEYSISRSYDETGLICEQIGDTPCDEFIDAYSIANGQLAIMDTENPDSRGYLNQVFDNTSPVNTAKLVAQKDYAKDVADNASYGLKMEDDYRTRISTLVSGLEASTVTAKFYIDEASTIVKMADSSRLEARLYAEYKYPNQELSLEASVRLRTSGDTTTARYVIATCFGSDCDDELEIFGETSYSGSFTGNHEIGVAWDSATEAFVFLVDRTEVGRVAMAEYNADSRVINAGGYTFNPVDYSGTSIRAEVNNVAAGGSGYLEVHVDEVSVDGEIYDDFTAGLIDEAKWSYDSEDR